jgi:site-specific DNA-methyltransferase (adenine-specific)
MEIKLLNGDCLIKLKELEANSVDSIVTDPPYELGFMNKGWDSSGIAFNKGVWEECLRVLKPGGHLLAFGGTRTYHRMTVAIEDSGFEIRDCIFWTYASGFPKSHNIGKAIDKLEGNEREVVGVDEDFVRRNPNNTGVGRLVTKSDGSTLDGRKTPYTKNVDAGIITKGNSSHEGWGTALKPAVEPVVMARKPFKGSVANNVLEWGTGAINIDECRISTDWKAERPESWFNSGKSKSGKPTYGGNLKTLTESTLGERLNEGGRWPANLILDEEAGKMLDEQSGISKPSKGRVGKKGGNNGTLKNFGGSTPDYEGKWPSDNGGGSSRFFYCPKVSKSERNEGLEDGNTHPTVKPQALMSYLIKLVTPKGGTVLDPFMGSGSTGKAAVKDGYSFIGIEREEEYFKIAEGRINAEAGPAKILNQFFE